MRVAINLVKDEVAQACVSAGNTGALMAISRFVLKTLPGIDRPAIAAQLPTRHGVITVLDLGANVNCSPEQLVQFAVMGSALVARWTASSGPSVGLLNVGEEDIKGNELAKQTGRAPEGSGLNFYGNVEGDDIYKGTTDVIVCDGFVGNVVAEGLRGPRGDALRDPEDRIHAQPAVPAGRARRVPGAARVQAPRRSRAGYNGATLIGLKGVVVKSHGSADALAFKYALRKALHGSRARRARQDRAADGDDAPSRRSTTRRWPRRRWAMHSRIVGTGSYLPAQILTNDDLAKRVDTSDAWIRARTGIRERRIAATAEKTSDLALHAARAALAAAGIAPGRRRSHHRRDDHAGHGLSVDRVHPAGEARRGRRAGVRRAGGVQRASSTRSRSPTGWSHRGWRATRWSSAPRSIRASSTGAIADRACCSATARARSCSCRRDGAGHRLGASARGRPLSRHPVRSGHGRGRRGQRHAVRAHGRPGGVQVRRQGHGRGRRGGARRQRRATWPPSTGSFRIRRTSGSWTRRAKKLGIPPRADDRRPSTGTPIRRRRRFRWRSTRRCATAASPRAIACC